MAFMLTPSIAVVFGPPPVIRMNAQPKFGTVFDPVSYVPAISLIVANDFG
jgi:hypothetical protein